MSEGKSERKTDNEMKRERKRDKKYCQIRVLRADKIHWIHTRIEIQRQRKLER